MYTDPEQKQGSTTRFWVSMGLLLCLLLVKLWTLSGHAQQRTIASGVETSDRFRPVDDENAQVWGLAGSILGLFSGGGAPPSVRQREADDEETYRRNKERLDGDQYWKEYDERREEERDQREQEMYDTQQRRAAEEQHYDQRREEQGY